jgi:hypothetical protein
MNVIGVIRRLKNREPLSTRTTGWQTGASRNTVKYLRAEELGKLAYHRRTTSTSPHPHENTLKEWQKADRRRPWQGLRTVLMPFAGSQKAGDADNYSRRVAGYMRWCRAEGAATGEKAAFAPRHISWPETVQRDWGNESLVADSLQVARIKLGGSRVSLLVAYPKLTREMLFKAPTNVFRALGATRRRGIYGPMKTGVIKARRGKRHGADSRFATMAARYLLGLELGNIGSGGEKGQFGKDAWGNPTAYLAKSGERALEYFRGA